jgi:hypothetical protein
MQLLKDVAQQASYQAMLPAAIAARQQAPITDQPRPADLSPALQDADRAMLGILLGVAS